MWCAKSPGLSARVSLISPNAASKVWGGGGVGARETDKARQRYTEVSIRLKMQFIKNIFAPSVSASVVASTKRNSTALVILVSIFAVCTWKFN